MRFCFLASSSSNGGDRDKSASTQRGGYRAHGLVRHRTDLPWIASVAVFLLWVICGILFASGFFDQVVMREFVARFGETIHRPQPLYFYLPHLLQKFAPWSVLIIAVALVDFHSRKWRLRSAFREMSPETFWLLCWSLGGVIVMSLIPSKRVDRIFPIIPPLCLLLAAQIGAR